MKYKYVRERLSEVGFVFDSWNNNTNILDSLEFTSPRYCGYGENITVEFDEGSIFPEGISRSATYEEFCNEPWVDELEVSTIKFNIERSIRYNPTDDCDYVVLHADYKDWFTGELISGDIFLFEYFLKIFTDPEAYLKFSLEYVTEYSNFLVQVFKFSEILNSELPLVYNSDQVGLSSKTISYVYERKDAASFTGSVIFTFQPITWEHFITISIHPSECDDLSIYCPVEEFQKVFLAQVAKMKSLEDYTIKNQESK